MAQLSRRTVLGAAWAAPVVVAAVSAPAASASGAVNIDLRMVDELSEAAWLTFHVTITGNLPAGFRTEFTWFVQGDPTVDPSSDDTVFPRNEGPVYQLWIPANNTTGSPIDAVLTVTAYGASASLPFQHPA